MGILKKAKKLYNIPEVPREWQCDIYSVFSEQIKDYNTYIDYYPGDKFSNVEPLKQTLKSLLEADFQYIYSHNQELLKDYKDKILFEEVNDRLPNSMVLFSDNSEENLILFNAPLLNIIHVFFSYFELLTQETKTQSCKEEYDPILKGERFSDTTLLAKIMNTIKYIYDDKSYYSDSSIDFLSEPYNVVERVQGARRFIIAHEIAHIVLGHKQSSYQDNPSDNLKSKYYYSKKEEYVADSLGAQMVLKPFAKRHLKELEFYELVNVLAGIRNYFVMLDMVESFHDWYSYKPQYPYAVFRDYAISNYLSLWSTEQKQDTFQYIHGLSNAKRLFKKLPFEAPALEFSSSIFTLMKKSEELSDKEVYGMISNNKTAEFLINNRGYYSLFEKYHIRDIEAIGNVDENEIGYYYFYYASQYGPEYALKKINRDIEKFVDYKQNPQAVLSLAGSEDFWINHEMRLAQIRMFNPSSFISHFNANVDHFYNLTLNSFRKFKNEYQYDN
jgi:hypothetical protein